MNLLEELDRQDLLLVWDERTEREHERKLKKARCLKDIYKK